MDDGTPLLPSLHGARAACEAATLLERPRMVTEDARRAYRESRTGGEFDEDDLVAGERLLVAAGFVEIEGDELAVSEDALLLDSLDDHTAAVVVVSRVLERRPPTWLRIAAGGGTVREALIPDAEVDELAGLIEDEARRDALLLNAVRQFEASRVAGLEALGFERVVEACREELLAADRPDLADAVQLVEAFGGILGHHVIAPCAAGGAPRRLHVATTRSIGWRREVQVARTAIEAGLADPAWALVVCEVDEDGGVARVGWCRAAEIAGLLPRDQHVHGQWLRASLALVSATLTQGLPPE